MLQIFHEVSISDQAYRLVNIFKYRFSNGLLKVGTLADFKESVDQALDIIVRVLK